MAEFGYKAKLELGQTDHNGNYISFNDPLIDLDMCSYSLACGVGPQGKIQTDIRGGNISFVISRIPTQTFLAWATEANRYFSGILHIVDFDDNPITKIKFETATCINLKINYVNEGNAYMVMEGVLQAENLQLPDTGWLMNRWNNEAYRNYSRVEEVKKKEETVDIRQLLNPNASITAFMILGKQTFELRGFELEFGQETDYKGEPQSEVHGGFPRISLYQLPDEKLNNWLMKRESLDGKFLFGDKMIGYELSIGFKKARCGSYLVNIGNPEDHNAIAHLVIVPETLLFGDLIYKAK